MLRRGRPRREGDSASGYHSYGASAEAHGVAGFPGIVPSRSHGPARRTSHLAPKTRLGASVHAVSIEGWRNKDCIREFLEGFNVNLKNQNLSDGHTFESMFRIFVETFV